MGKVEAASAEQGSGSLCMQALGLSSLRISIMVVLTETKY